MSLTLTRRVAELIDPLAFNMTPQNYGLKTIQELEEQTLVGPARQIANEKARAIIALVRVEIIKMRA